MLCAENCEFCIEEVDDNNGFSLISSVSYLTETEKNLNVKKIKSLLVDRMKTQQKLEIPTVSYMATKVYQDRIKKEKLLDGQLDIRNLAYQARLWIRIVSIDENSPNHPMVNVFDYAEHDPFFEDCVYILHNKQNNHYDPLIIKNKSNSNETSKIFEYKNKIVFELLCKFIRKKFLSKQLRSNYSVK